MLFSSCSLSLQPPVQAYEYQPIPPEDRPTDTKKPTNTSLSGASIQSELDSPDAAEPDINPKTLFQRSICKTKFRCELKPTGIGICLKPVNDYKELIPTGSPDSAVPSSDDSECPKASESDEDMDSEGYCSLDESEPDTHTNQSMNETDEFSFSSSSQPDRKSSIAPNPQEDLPPPVRSGILPLYGQVSTSSDCLENSINHKLDEPPLLVPEVPLLLHPTIKLKTKYPKSEEEMLAVGDGLTVKQSPGKGNGVYTDVFINKMEFPTWVDGTIAELTPKERQEHLKDLEASSHTIAFNQFKVMKGYKDPVYAQNARRGAGSFINLSSRRFNVEYVVRDDIKAPWIYIRAVRNIEPGEELLVNYGNGYWKLRQIKPYDEDGKQPENTSPADKISSQKTRKRPSLDAPLAITRKAPFLPGKSR